jgi:uncharacterized membrane protein
MNLLDTLNSPSMLHAATVHFPVVLAMLGVPLLALSAWFGKNVTLRLLTLATFVGLAVSCMVAEATGEGAYGVVPNELSQEIWDKIEEHEELAERLKFLAAGISVLLALSFIPVSLIRQTTMLLAGIGAVLSAFLVTITAHHGGDLVYKHGVGTPAMHAAAAEPKEDAAADEELVVIRDIDPAEAAQVSYVDDIRPIFDQYCMDCHDGPGSDGEYDMTTVATMSLAGEKAGPGIIPGDPDKSSMVQYIRGELKPRMPRRKPPLSEDDLHLIRMWISAGAKDDSGAAPAPAPASAPEVMEEAVDPFAAPPATEEPAPAPAPEVMEEAVDPFAAPAVTEEPAPAPAPEVIEEAVDPFAAPAVTEEPAPAPAPEVMEEAVDPFAAPVVTEEPAPAPASEVMEEAVDPFAAPAVTEEPTPVPAPEVVEEAMDPFAAPAVTEEQPVSAPAPEVMEEAVDPFAAPAVEESPLAAEPAPEAMEVVVEPIPSSLEGEASEGAVSDTSAESAETIKLDVVEMTVQE